VEWREHGSPRRLSQDAMTRFTACPSLYLCSFWESFPGWTA
jgi:hypothetical protein